MEPKDIYSTWFVKQHASLIYCGHSEKLEEIRDLERREEAFTPVPSPYYMELTKLLLNQ